MNLIVKNESLFKILGFFSVAAYIILAAFQPLKFHFIDAVNLVMHEAGHTLFFPFGEFLYVAGGTIMQIAVPALCAWYFLTRKELISASLICMWIGESIIGVSVYAGDALTRVLPLLNDDPSSHDWYYVLETTNLLSATQGIALTLYIIGWGIIISAVCLGMWLLSVENTNEIIK